MPSPELLDRAIPDRVRTDPLPAGLAAEIDHFAGRSEAWTSRRAEVHPGVRARALVDTGDHDAARHVLDECIDGRWSPQGLTAATWAASRVGSPEAVGALTTEVGALAQDFVVDGPVPLGPRALFTGLLAAARGELDDACAALQEAVAVGDRRAPFWGALGRVELGRVLLTVRQMEPADGPGWKSSDRSDRRRQAGGPEVDYGPVLVAARTFFAAGGYRHLGRVARSIEQPALASAAMPGLGHLVRNGSRWHAGFGVQPPVEVRASKGLMVLRHLVEHRHRKVPVVELDRLLSGEQVNPDEQLAMEQLLDHPEAGASTEALRAVLFDDRARSRVTKLLRRTIDRLSQAHALVGRHLEATIRTGYACGYAGGSGIIWRL